MADAELNLGGGGVSRPEGPSREGRGVASPPVGGGLGASPEKFLKKMMQNGAIWGAT